MNKEESLQHIEIFVRNKIREGYGGSAPDHKAKKNVMSMWRKFKKKGANAEASIVLGGNDEVEKLLHTISDNILNSVGELYKTLTGKYEGSHESLIDMTWEQNDDGESDDTNNTLNVDQMNTGEKTLLISLVLEHENIKEVILLKHSTTDYADTIQSLLVDSLDFFYVFANNQEFRDSHIKKAASMAIEIADYRLDPSYLFKLGKYYVMTRDYSPTEIDEIEELWQDMINEPNHNSTDTIDDAVLYWGECVVRILQVESLMRLGNSFDVLDDEGFRNDVKIHLSINRPLIAAYLDVRSNVK